MDRQTIPTGLTPDVIVDQVQGGLQIKGWDRPEVFVKAASPDILKVDKTDNGVRITCQGECILRVPRSATLWVGEVQGSVRAKYLDRRLKIDLVQGSLGMRNIGEVQVGTIDGDLLVKHVSDNLQVSEIKGNAIVCDVQGDCSLGLVQGRLDATEVSGGVTANAEAHARLRLNLVGGREYAIKSGGHLHCQVPDDASLQVDFTSQSSEIQIRLPGKKDDVSQTNHSLTLGNGDAHMALTAQEAIYFSSQEADWDDLEDIDVLLNEEFTRISDEFTRQIESQIEVQMELLNEHMSRLSETISQAGLSQAEAERLIRQAETSGEQAAARAHEKMRHAQEKIERKLAAAQSKAKKKPETAGQDDLPHEQRGSQFERPSGAYSRHNPAAFTPPEDKDLEEERLVILRMLGQKKITLDEAEKLLSALEGKES